MLVDALCKKGMAKEAEGILKIMIPRGEKPNVYTHNALMGGYCLLGRMGKAPNICSYNILIEGYCSAMIIDEPCRLSEEFLVKR